MLFWSGKKSNSRCYTSQFTGYAIRFHSKIHVAAIGVGDATLALNIITQFSLVNNVGTAPARQPCSYFFHVSASDGARFKAARSHRNQEAHQRLIAQFQFSNSAQYTHMCQFHTQHTRTNAPRHYRCMMHGTISFEWANEDMCVDKFEWIAKHMHVAHMLHASEINLKKNRCKENIATNRSPFSTN